MYRKRIKYRGSKSIIFLTIIVKEQRVDGNCCMKEMQLRGILIIGGYNW